MFQLEDGLLLLGVVLVTMWLLMRIRKRRTKAGPRLSPREELERAHQSRGLRGDLEELMVEVEQLAKRFGTQLDAKSIQLERLIRQSDERIEALHRLAETSSNRSMPRSTEVRSDLADLASHAPAIPAPAAATPNTESHVDDGDPLTKSVYELADAGTDPVEIAKKLNEQVGKVELILALRNA